MKFSCNQDTFSKYMGLVSRIVNNKPGLPILNNVYFESNEGKLVMKATDLELSLSTWIGADISEDGKTTVPAKQLSEFISNVPEEKVDVEVASQNFDISTTNNNASFNTMPSEDFPSIPTLAEGQEEIVRINKGDFISSVNRVGFAVATDDVKPVLTGVKIEVEEGSISFVATDGLRLSRQVVPIEKSNKTTSLLVPVRALQEMAYIVSSVDSEDEWVYVYEIEDKNQVMFRYADVDVCSRLIDGEYPEYKQIIPTGYTTRCNIVRGDFTKSIKVVNIIARSVLGNKMILDIAANDGKISLSATQSDLGKNNSTFPCTIEGKDLKIAFSAKLLSDVLDHVDSDNIVFECSEPVRPGVFKIDGDDNFIHLVMPMML